MAEALKASTAPREIQRHSRPPPLAQAGPVSLWMILFVTIPMLFIIYISFMTRGTFGGVEYVFSTDSYQTLLDSTYFKVIVKSFQVAVVTTVAVPAGGLSLRVLYRPQAA